MRKIKLVQPNLLAAKFFRMKETISILSYVLLVMFFFSACKKGSIDANFPQNPANEKLIPMIKLWLEIQKKDLPEAALARIESLESNLNYAEMRLEKYKESKELIVIPVLSGFKSKNNSDKNPVNYLVLVFENQDSITRGNIIQYISSNNQKTAPINTFYKIFTYHDLNCSGQFTILSITDYFRYELKFENGKLRSVMDQKKKNHTNNGSGRENSDCIDWYLQIWYVWGDGSVTLESETYVYTTCDGDCAQPRLAGGRSYGTSCNGNPGGGGGNDVDYEYYKARTFAWTVEGAGIAGAYITSYDQVKGKKTNYPYPGAGYVTDINHQTSVCSCPNNGVWGENNNSNFSIIGGYGVSNYARAYVEGIVSYQGSNFPYSNSKHFYFEDL